MKGVRLLYAGVSENGVSENEKKKHIDWKHMDLCVCSKFFFSFNI